jgi:hypothetical protein
MEGYSLGEGHSTSRARRRLYYSHELLLEKSPLAETCMNDKDCTRIVFAREVIITPTYENR